MLVKRCCLEPHAGEDFHLSGTGTFRTTNGDATETWRSGRIVLGSPPTARCHASCRARPRGCRFAAFYRTFFFCFCILSVSSARMPAATTVNYLGSAALDHERPLVLAIAEVGFEKPLPCR